MGKLECENGDATHPFYQFLKGNSNGGLLGKGLKWNFTKFLCDERGVPIERYLPTTNPRSIEPDIVKILEREV
jgi:glutathione peroxidase